MIRILVSPSNVEEAMECVKGGADIIDVKNPREGSLGANFPWIIKEIACLAKNHGKEVSATIGDIDSKPGTASLAALGATVSGVDYVKVGLFVGKTDIAFEILLNVVKAVEGYDVKVVAATYADWKRVQTIPPSSLPEIAVKAGADGIMIDTAVKDGLSLFDFMDIDSIASFVDSAHDNGMFCALAGALNWNHLNLLKELKPDIIGVRTMVCESGRNSKIKSELVEKLVKSLR
jgi:uncharacterized protein (UPF0264 family)